MFIPSKKQTVEHLQELKDEVGELHPLLNVLLRKLPDIDRVHYNHGNSELGADFILFKRDKALARTTCIGVIAKVDPIRQNTTDVERQIKECFIARRASDGTQIQIREVWVISSQDITKNARDVIGKLYDDKKVEFIGVHDLAGMIDGFAPDSFVTMSPYLQDYAEKILSAFDAEDQRSLIIPGLDAFYVEPQILRRGFDGYKHHKSMRKVQSFDELLSRLTDAQFSIIQAGAGGGKSRLARELSKRVVSRVEYADGKLIPYVVHSKHFVDNLDENIGKVTGNIKEETKTEAKVILFLDGFDELGLSEPDRAKVVEQLIESAAQHKVSIVLMSRPFDEVAALGVRLQSLDIYQIEPLQGSRALTFLAKVAGGLDVRSKLIADLNSSPLLKALDGTPVAYILLGRMIAENQQDLPSNLTELFQKYSELVLGRWEISKGLRSQKEYEILVEALIWLSTYMLDNQLDEVGRQELEKWIADYCRARGFDFGVPQLVDNLCGRNSILYLRADIGVVGFRHRAFSEFFYAKGLLRKSKMELSEEIFSPYWINSYYFFAGLQKDCPDLLRSLIDLSLDAVVKRLLRVLNFGNLMLAGYMTPLNVCKDALKKLSFEASDIFLETCNPASKSPLTEFPTIQALCMITSVFHNQYGYAHFRSVLEEAIYDLEDSVNEERHAIALFLLNTAYKESGGELRFDQLIEKSGNFLPLSVKLAIGHESERMKVTSERVRKMEKHLRRSFGANVGSHEFLRKMYEVPVKKLDKPL